MTIDSRQRPRVAFVTLGCPKNEVDTGVMGARVVAAGFHLVDDPADAEVVVVNTCSFIQEATEESIATIFSLLQDADDATPRHVIVAGCMVSRYGDDLSSSLPEAAAFVPVAHEEQLPDVIAQLTGTTTRPALEADVVPLSSGPSAYLRVSDGCHRACAYCTIPQIRGPYVSRPLDGLVREARVLIERGARELVLIGQDITAWGRDLEGGLTITDLVDELACLPGLGWLRLMYAQPDGVTTRLLDSMAGHPTVCHYLDMPLQHASPTVLRRMRRRGGAESYMKLLTRIRDKMPDVVLRTTLIAGFPGETRGDAALLERFVQAADFDYTGVFVYSPEEGTAAATFPQQVPLRTRRARAQRLRDLGDAIGFARAATRIGQELEVLVEGRDLDEGVVVGRWRGQAPDVDGIVLLDSGSPGDIVIARIVDSVGYDLEGEVL